MTNMLSAFNVYAIADAATAASGGEGDIYFGYSGRGMYGATCIGVTLRSVADLYTLGVALASSDEDLADRLGEPHTDDLGMGIIAYWPKWDAEVIDQLV